MATYKQKITELERRVLELEQEVFGGKRTIVQATPAVQSPPIQHEDLKIPEDILPALQAQIRKVGYWSLVLILLYFAPHSLTYSDIMSISKQLKKPVSYRWLDTEFHRKKYSGLVRSEPIPGSQERAYILNEPGRRKAETALAKLKAAKD